MTLDEEDIIRINRPKGFLGGGWDANVVNFNYVLKTGKIPDRTNVMFGFRAGDYHIDWQRDDAFTRALNTIEMKSSERIQESPELQRLLTKDQWSKADREQWEGRVSGIVAEETARIPGFAHYRTFGNEKKSYRTDAKDIDCLNGLSSDIEHNTEHLSFDCGVESIVKGVTIQRLENSLLPAQASNAADFKKASSYFYVTGGVNFGDDSEKPGNHASIFTPSGNTIEGTETGYSYRRSVYADSTLERLVRGKAFFALDGSVYDQPNSGGQPAILARASAKRSHDDSHEDGRIFSWSQLWMRDGHEGTRLSEAAEDGFIIAATKRRDGIPELKIYQKQMAGTPQEGYVMVGYAAGAKANARLTREYEDSLTGKSYKFSAAFDQDDVQMTVAREGRSFGVDWWDRIIVQERKPFSPAGTSAPADTFQSTPSPPASAAGNVVPAVQTPKSQAYRPAWPRP